MTKSKKAQANHVRVELGALLPPHLYAVLPPLDYSSAILFLHQERRLAELQTAVANFLLSTTGSAEAAERKDASAESTAGPQSTTMTNTSSTPKSVSPQPIGRIELCNIVKQEVKTIVPELDLQIQKRLKDFRASMNPAKVEQILQSKSTFKKEIIADLHGTGHRVCDMAPPKWEERLELIRERVYLDGFQDGMREAVSQEVRKHMTPALERIIQDKITSETTMAKKQLRELASQSDKAQEEARSVRDDLRNEKATISGLVKYIKHYDQRVKAETEALKDVPRAIESAKADIKAMVSRNGKVLEKTIKDFDKAAKTSPTQIAKLETKAFDEAVLGLDKKVAEAVATIKQAEVTGVEVITGASATAQESLNALSDSHSMMAKTVENGLKEAIGQGEMVASRLQDAMTKFTAKEEGLRETAVEAARDLGQTVTAMHGKSEIQVDLAKDEIAKEMVRAIKSIVIAGQMAASPANDKSSHDVGPESTAPGANTILTEEGAKVVPTQVANDKANAVEARSYWQDTLSSLESLNDSMLDEDKQSYGLVSGSGEGASGGVAGEDMKGKGKERAVAVAAVKAQPPVKTRSAEWLANVKSGYHPRRALTIDQYADKILTQTIRTKLEGQMRDPRVARAGRPPSTLQIPLSTESSRSDGAWVSLRFLQPYDLSDGDSDQCSL